MLIPAMRAIGGTRNYSWFNKVLSTENASVLYPWRCLCRGSAQITRTTRLRRTILHLRQIFFTEAMTFIVTSFGPKRNAAFGQIVGRHLHRHLVARQDADVVHPHLPGDEGMDDVPVLQLHPEGRVRQVLHHFALHFDDVFLGHRSFSEPLATRL